MARVTRALILNYEYPPLGGGAGVALRYLLGGLDGSMSVSADVVTSSTGENRIERVSERTKIHFLDIGKRGSLHHQSNRELVTYAVRAYFYARRLVSRSSYDLIHAFFGIPSGYVAMKLGLPYIVSLRGSDVPFYNQRFKTLDRLFFARASRSVWRRAARVVANSEGLRDLARRTSPNQPIDVIYNAVDTDYFAPRPGDTRSGTDARGLSIVSTGRLIPRKGFNFLIEALEGIPGVTLSIIGDGNERQALMNLARRCGVEATFPGNLDRDAVRTRLRSADLFVLPSLNEGMSNALLEAMACGLPVIATDVGGTRELLRGNGAIVRKGDREALSSAVRGYLEAPDLIYRHGLVSREIACSMSIEEMTERYLDIYREVASAGA